MDILKMSKMTSGHFGSPKTHEKWRSQHNAHVSKIFVSKVVTDTFWTFLSGLDIFGHLQSFRFSETIIL